MNYIGRCRTNYFSVKNEVKFREIISRLVAEDDIRIFQGEGNATGKVAFGGGSICGIRPENYKDENCDEDNIIEGDEWLFELQEVVADDDAIIITDAGSEGMRYIYSGVTVITSHDIKYKGLEEIGLKLAREALGNPNWKTRNSY